MARSSLTHSASLVFALLIVTDPQFATGASEETHTEPTNTTTITATVGDKVVLRCPLPDAGKRVSWSRQGRNSTIVSHYKNFHFTHISDDIEVTCLQRDYVCLLTIRNVEKADSGIYYCEVDSKPPTQHSIKLSVLDRVVTILGEPFRSQMQGSAVKITCKVELQQEPEDTVLWLRDNKLIDPDHDSRLIITTKMDITTISHLLLKDVQPKDSGIYTCKLHNGRSDSVNVEVLRGDDPAVPDDLHSTVSGAQRPLAAVPAAGLLALAVAAAALSIRWR